MLLAGGALALLLALAVFLLAETRLGLTAALRLVETVAGVEITARGLTGRPISGLRAERLEVAWPQNRVVIDGLAAGWQLKLSGHSLVVGSLRVEELRLELADAKPPESLPVVDPGLVVVVESFEIDRVQVVLEGTAEPLLLSGLRGAAALENSVIEIPSLTVRGEAMTVGGSVRVDTAADWHHRVELSADLEDGPVELALEGDLGETRVRASAPDWGVEIDGRLLAVLTRPAVDLDLRCTLDPIDAALRLAGTLPVIEVNGSIGAGDETMMVNGVRAELRDGVVRLSGELAVSSAGIEIALDPSEVGLGAGGSVRLGAVWRWQGAPTGPLAGAGLRGGTGRLTADGSFDALTVAAGGVVPIGGRPFDVALDALLSSQRARLDRFTVSGAGAEIALAGYLGWGEALEVDTRGTVRGLDPAVLWPDWPARIDGALAISGTDRRLEIVLEGLRGRFLDRPLRGEGRAVLEELSLASASLAVRSGRSRIDIEAPAWPEEPIRASFDLRDLGDLVPGATGSARATAQITPHVQGLEIEAEISGSSIRWKDWSLAALDGEAALDLRPGRDLVARLETGLLTGPVDVDSLRFEGRGRDRSFDFTTRALSPLGESIVAGTADLSRERHRIRLDRLDLSTRDFGDWALIEPIAVAVAGDELRLELAACLASAGTRLCVELPGPRDAPGTLVLERFPLGLLDGVAGAAAGRPVVMAGLLDADFSWRLEAGRPVINGTLSSDGVAITLVAGEEPLQLTGLRLVARGEEDLELDLEVAAAGASGRLSGRITHWGEPDDASLDLALDLDLPDLGELGLPGLPVEDLSGTVVAALEIWGRPKRPAIDGRVTVSDVGFFAPEPGLEARDGDLKVLFDDGGEVKMSGRIAFEEGWMDLDGHGLLGSSQPPAADVRVRVRDALLVDRSGTRVQADADLTLAVDASGLSMTGDVDIEDTRIVLGPVTEAVRPSPDVVFAGQAAPLDAPAPAMPLAVDVRVRAVTPIVIVGNGLDAELTGEVQVTEHQEHAASATGTLNLAGTFSRYGQAVKISRGRIVFARSSLLDPLLDVEATRETGPAFVGVRLNGPVSEPVVELFSEPPLAESEILSLLVLGYSLENPTEQELGALSAALTGLRMGTGERAEGEPSLMERLGFARFGLIADEELGGTGFAIGRYLAPRLYLEYSIGLEDSIDVLSLWYRLSEHWAVGAAAGVDTRGAVTYRIKPESAADEPAIRKETEP